MRKLIVFIIIVFLITACSDDGTAPVTTTLTVSANAGVALSASISRVAISYPSNTSPVSFYVYFTNVSIITGLSESWQTVFSGNSTADIASASVMLANKVTVAAGTYHGIKIVYMKNWIVEGTDPTTYSYTNNNNVATNTTIYFASPEMRNILTNTPYNIPEGDINVLMAAFTINEGENKTATILFNTENIIQYDYYGPGDFRNFQGSSPSVSMIIQ